MKKQFLPILLLYLFAIPLQAKKTHSFRTEVQTPEEQLAGFELPDGFVIELVASERDGIINPIDLAFDDAGRLWTQTATMYPLDPAMDIEWGDLLKLMDNPEAQRRDPAFKRILDLYEGKTQGEDKILIIDNPTAINPSKARTWADGLTIPQSILPYKNGAYVAQGSELFFLEDSNGDGTADTRKPLLSGFGFTDTHTMAHLLIRAPGNWIHFSQGALNKGLVKSAVSGAEARIDFSKIARVSLDGSRLNVVSSGLNNIWGFQLRANGQWYGTEANDKTWSVVPMEAGTGFQGIGNTRMRPYQPWIPEMHEFRVGGTGISGLEFSEDGVNSFPEQWKDVALLANPITSTVNCVRIVRNSDGTVSAELLPDLLKSKDDWFRPVNMEFGPDGCLYIADWYNKIISHNELPRTHPERDKGHGRIWRIRHQSQIPGKIPNLYETPTSDLVSHLKAPTLWEKRAAWHQISDRSANELAPQLIRLAENKKTNVTTRIHALWSLEGLKHFDAHLMDTLIAETEDELRREAIRSLSSFDIEPSQMASYLNDLTNDPNVMIRSQVLRTLADYGQANRETIDILVSYCRPDIPEVDLGGPYERSFERYLARMALEQYPDALIDYLDHPLSKKQPATHRFWAIQALTLEKKEAYFVDFWDALKSEPWNLATFIEILNAMEKRSIHELAKPVFQNLWNARHLVSLANEALGKAATENLISLLKPGVKYLLASKDQSDQEIGLKAARNYKMTDLEIDIIQLLDSPNSNRTVVMAAISALERKPSPRTKAIFQQRFENASQSFDLRLATLHALLKAQGQPDPKYLDEFLGSLNDFQKSEFTKTLSSSRPGAQTLLSLLNEGRLAENEIDNWTLDRMLSANIKAPRLRALQKERKQNKEAAFKKTFDTVMKIAESESGNPLKGQPLFTSLCLACHSTGGEGIGWAPALDGSGHRDNEGLLTAVIDPSAAMEGAYRLRRILKTDGTTIEGYLEKQNEHGATLRFMGGGSLFVSNSEIKTVQQVQGRSSMPEGLIDNLPQEQLADLLAYIRTLK
ncbi:MAG: c-type cytochrome [Opitutales bacterium]|jgi:putative membrane-bound dehydrogenase-like protein|nr:c-type cytochrome [Opitutales bacterium]MBT6770728.1 c-type cytochrome [Opitutales bacterium]